MIERQRVIERDPLLRKIMDGAIEHGFKYPNNGMPYERSIKEGVSLRRGNVEMYIYKDYGRDGSPIGLTVLVLSPGLLTRWESWAGNAAQQLKGVNGVLEYDLIGKPAGQETGAGTATTKPSGLRRVFGKLGI